MTDLPESHDPGAQDDVIARALHSLPIPDHRRTFWADLDAAIAEPSVPKAEVAAAADPTVHRLDTGELPSVTALDPERHRRRRRSPILAAAAAVVILAGAVGAVLVIGGDGDGGDDDSEFADGPRDTTGSPRSEPFGSETTALATTTSITSPTSSTLFAAAPDTAAAAVEGWLGALGAGDGATAMSLTGPRSLAYIEATNGDVDAFFADTGLAEGYGAWSGAPDLEVSEIPLGAVEAFGGEVAVVVVSGTNPGEGREGPSIDVFPVVNAGDGWKLELYAFDPSVEDAQVIVQIPSAPQGESGLGSMTGDQAVEVIVPTPGRVLFRIDDGEPVVRETSTVGTGAGTQPYARFDPPGTLIAGDHDLVVVGVGDNGTFAYVAGPVTVER